LAKIKQNPVKYDYLLDFFMEKNPAASDVDLVTSIAN